MNDDMHGFSRAISKTMQFSRCIGNSERSFADQPRRKARKQTIHRTPPQLWDKASMDQKSCEGKGRVNSYVAIYNVRLARIWGAGEIAASQNEERRAFRPGL